MSVIKSIRNFLGVECAEIIHSTTDNKRVTKTLCSGRRNEVKAVFDEYKVKLRTQRGFKSIDNNSFSFNSKRKIINYIEKLEDGRETIAYPPYVSEITNTETITYREFNKNGRWLAFILISSYILFRFVIGIFSGSITLLPYIIGALCVGAVVLWIKKSK